MGFIIAKQLSEILKPLKISKLLKEGLREGHCLLVYPFRVVYCNV